jgi:hypothetical protein
VNYWYQQLCVGCFLVFILLGLTRTFIGWPQSANNSLSHFAYGTMAPYQGYETEVRMLKVEQLHNGIWTIIPLEEFWPFSYPERSVRGYMLQWYDFKTPLYTHHHVDGYRRLAKALYIWSQKSSNPAERIRIGVEIWPLTLAAPEFLHLPEFTSYVWLTEYPTL